MIKSIIVAGVGGQGTLLASKLIGTAALNKGLDIKASEVHGMAQRGGSVVTYVRYSDKPISSPIVDPGAADIILGFEALEAYRSIHLLKKDGLLIINTQQINPMPVMIGAEKYPDNIIGKLKDMGVRMIALDALELARKAGNAKVVNNVLIGVMAKDSDFTKDEWSAAVKEVIPANLLDANEKAFELGYSILSGA
jgi:indolepyruvate ferredoxin oxidoreductase beta subunit